MHNNGVSKKQLAAQLGITGEYVSMVLAGKCRPKGAQQRFEAAVNNIISERGAENEEEK